MVINLPKSIEQSQSISKGYVYGAVHITANELMGNCLNDDD